MNFKISGQLTSLIIIIIIKSLINSAAHSDVLQAYVIQCCGTGVPSGVVQKLPSTVTKDAGRLVGCFKCLDRKQQSSCELRPMVVTGSPAFTRFKSSEWLLQAD